MLILLASSSLLDAREDPAPRSDQTVVYPVEFFDRYRPVTARDMVEQVPGFQIDNGGSRRGFGGTSGNVLINGRRPSSKTDGVSEILERIPARQVREIERILGNTGRFDAAGQEQLVNVIVDADQRTWAWESTLEQDADSGGPTPGVAVSVRDRAGATEWGTGLNLSTSYVGNTATETRFEPAGAVESRDEFERFRNHSARLNANSSTALDAATLRLNLELSFSDSDFRENSRRARLPESNDPFNLDRRADTDRYGFELGGDYAWTIATDWTAKLIALIRRDRTDDLSQLLRGPERGRVEVQQQSDRRTDSGETIGRIEIDWNGADRHLLELDLEGALNRLENTLQLLIRNDGALVEAPVPGADNEVEELRGELTLRDTWEVGRFSLESALGLEASEISQSGAGVPDNRFFFAKPSLTLNHAASSGRTDRLEFRREVAQLNFNDFVSATNFGDADIDRGNPDLEPQHDWLLQASTENRFGAVGSTRLTVFHRWVRDVQDLLPVTGGFEVPGNIGDGRRWGASLEGTVPLDPIGLRATRLDLDARWEDSKVTDPVTGAARRFSGQRGYALESEIRQDLAALRIAWGVEAEYEDTTTRFELEEIDIEESGLDVEPFIESTRWLGVKMRLTVQNLLNRKFERDRRVFEPDRNQETPRFRELRDRRRGRSILFSVGGSF